MMHSPVDLVKNMTRPNLDLMNSLQKTFLGAINPGGKVKPDESDD
jgi:hypothetical protein